MISHPARRYWISEYTHCIGKMNRIAAMRAVTRSLLIFAVLAVLLALPAHAAVVNVACDSAALAAAVAAANASDEPDTLNLSPGCIYGFSLSDSTNPDSALPRATGTLTLNGNGAAIERASEAPDFRLLYVTSTANVTLNGVTLRRGSAAIDGGGIYNEGTLTVNGSMLTGNSAVHYGGTLYSTRSVTLTHSVIAGSAAFRGGGIYNSGGSLIVSGSTITGNLSSMGGGINCSGGTLTLTDSTLSGNTSMGIGGGALYNAAATTVMRTAFTGNSAGEGGAIYSLVPMDVIDSTFTGNSAGSGGAIQTFNTMRVINSVISGNSASEGGGLMSRGSITVTNSLISGNFAGEGGGINVYNGSVTIIQSTIAGNRTTGLGGGISVASFSAYVFNSIIWGNSGQQVYDNSPVNNEVIVTSSDVQGGFTGDDNIDANPLFVSPAALASAPSTAGDYRLRLASPAANAGNGAFIPDDVFDLDGDGDSIELLPYDLDGSPRMHGGTVDMGAYEWPLANELLVNGGFELDANNDKTPDGWKLAKAVGDKRVCLPASAHSGSCGFVFKGSATEKSTLSQIVGLNGIAIQQGDTLSLAAFVSGSHAKTKAVLMLTLSYAPELAPVKTSIIIGPNDVYSWVALPPVNVGGGLSSIKVSITNKSKAGALSVDDVSLTLSRTSTRGAVLPPPSTPSGMRGLN